MHTKKETGRDTEELELMQSAGEPWDEDALEGSGSGVEPSLWLFRATLPQHPCTGKNAASQKKRITTSAEEHQKKGNKQAATPAHL